jgi:hypothetical protein
MNTRRAAVTALLMVASATVLAAAFVDPVTVEKVIGTDPESAVVFLSPPKLSAEVSWPLCKLVSVRIALEPIPILSTWYGTAVTADGHRAALKRLREAAGNGTIVYFGPAGKGLVQAKDDHCRLNSRGLAIVETKDGKDVIISFHD